MFRCDVVALHILCVRADRASTSCGIDAWCAECAAQQRQSERGIERIVEQFATRLAQACVRHCCATLLRCASR
eukprot:917380-Lingulodinium_polyedra.AAC.1